MTHILTGLLNKSWICQLQVTLILAFLLSPEELKRFDWWVSRQHWPGISNQRSEKYLVQPQVGVIYPHWQTGAHWAETIRQRQYLAIKI